jgi:hypothetical protein
MNNNLKIRLDRTENKLYLALGYSCNEMSMLDLAIETHMQIVVKFYNRKPIVMEYRYLFSNLLV